MVDTKGQTNILGAAVGAIIGFIAILIVVKVYDAIPKDNISAATQSLLVLVPLVLGAVIILSIIISTLVRGR